MVVAGILGFSTMVLVLGALSSSPAVSPMLFFVVLTILYFCIGLFTASSYALFMGLSRPPLAATQFSAFMAATNGCEDWTSWLGGLIVSRSGYTTAFVFMSVVSLCVLPLVKWLESSIEPLASRQPERPSIKT
jgi:MFS family permease